MDARGVGEPDGVKWFVGKERLEPGMPIVLRTPRDPTFTVAPSTPKLAVIPLPDRFSRTPGNTSNDCLNRSPMSPIPLCDDTIYLTWLRGRAGFVMVFGLFRKNAKPEMLVADAPVTATSLVPAFPDEDRLAQLGPILWQDVRYGMTPGEVAGVRSDAVRSPQDHKLHDAATAQLFIPHLRLGGHDYAVLFYFKENTLTQVTVKTNGGPELSDFHDLLGALRLRYGQEVEMKESHDSFSSAEWLSNDGTNISLICHPEIGCLNVNFQYRYANAARQL